MPKKTPATELVVATPAAPTMLSETNIDEALIDQAVADIRQIVAANKHIAARQIGELLLVRFFDGSIANARARKGEHSTFKALEARKDLGMSATSLWYCVAVQDHYENLGADLCDALTLGHHRHLAHVPDEDKRRELASAVKDKGLSVRDLKSVIDTEVTKVSPGVPRRGRPTHPVAIKSLKGAERAVNLFAKLDVDLHLNGLDGATRQNVIAGAKALHARLGELVARLEPAT